MLSTFTRSTVCQSWSASAGIGRAAAPQRMWGGAVAKAGSVVVSSEDRSANLIENLTPAGSPGG